MAEDIAIEEVVKARQGKDVTLVDVRSPQEFREGTIPGSVNVPILDDEERKIVGTLYNHAGTHAAKEKGLEIVAAKLPAFIRTIRELPGKKIVFCWRGGMRSKAAATVLSLMGVDVCRLIGGYRSYRKWVVQTLENFELKPECIVINGYTGAGKSRLLRALDQKGYPVLDLEAMASHRGSFFGHIGLEPHNQKTFDALLLDRLLELNNQPYILMEAESTRIGKAVMPDFLVRGKERGRMIVIDLPIEERVKNILADYDPVAHKAECIRAYERIRERIHVPVAKQISGHLERDEFSQAIRLMLEYYYDKRYEYAMNQYRENEVWIRAANVEDAVRKTEEQLHRWGFAAMRHA